MAVKTIFKLAGALTMMAMSAVARQTPPRVALYLDHGCRGAGTIAWAQLLSRASDLEFSTIDAAEIMAGALDKVDCLVMPGGGGLERYRDWGEAGCAKIRRFVERGGRYLGTCAGESVLLNEPNRVRLLPFKGDGSWGRGGMSADIELDARFAELTGVPAGHRAVRYHNGPCVVPADPVPGCRAEVMARFNCTLMAKGTMPSEMNGKPAAIWAEYGQGRIFVFAVHPEVSPANRDLVRGAFEALLGVKIEFARPAKAKRPWRVAFYAGEIDAGDDTREIVRMVLALDAKEKIDLIAIAAEDVEAGALDHADALVLPRNRRSKLSAGAQTLIGEFIRRGGIAASSAEELEVLE